MVLFKGKWIQNKRTRVSKRNPAETEGGRGSAHVLLQPNTPGGYALNPLGAPVVP